MADGFDVVSVRPDDECAVVVGVIVLAQARRPVVLASSRQRRLVELAKLLSILGRESNVNGPETAAERAEPELGFAGTAEHDPAFTFRRDADAQRVKRLEEERLAALEVRDVEADVIEDHRKPPCGRLLRSREGGHAISAYLA